MCSPKGHANAQASKWTARPNLDCFSDSFQQKDRNRTFGLLLMIPELRHLVGLLFVQPIAFLFR